MTKEVRKKQLALRTAALLAALVVIAGLVIFLVIRFVPSGKHMDAASYFGVSEGRTPVVADGKVLSGKSIENGPELYLDLEDVSASVNSSFFYEDTEDLLIVSAPREVYKMSLSGGRTGNGEAVREDESIGVSLSFLERMTDAVFACAQRSNISLRYMPAIMPNPAIEQSWHAGKIWIGQSAGIDKVDTCLCAPRCHPRSPRYDDAEFYLFLLFQHPSRCIWIEIMLLDDRQQSKIWIVIRTLVTRPVPARRFPIAQWRFY